MPEKRNLPDDKKLRDNRTRLLIIAAVVLACIAFAAKIFPVADDTSGDLVYNLFLRVAIIVFATGIAWPQLKALKASSYGRLLIGGLAVAALFMMIQPRSKTAVVPIIIVSVVLLIAVTFLRNLFSSPPGKK